MFMNYRRKKIDFKLLRATAMENEKWFVIQREAARKKEEWSIVSTAAATENGFNGIGDEENNKSCF